MKKQPNEITVRVTRAFCMGGEPVPVDTVITLQTSFARELIAARKAEITNEKPGSQRPARPAPAGSAAKPA